MTGAALFLAGLLSLLAGGACDIVTQMRQRADLAAFAIGYEDAQARFLHDAEARFPHDAEARFPHDTEEAPQ